MAQRRHHYERAFEAYLRERRIPYVAVNEARKALLPHGARLRLDGAGDAGPDLKSFDFVVYGENTNMLNIARASGAKVVRDGSESEAYLRLPPADIDSRMTEMVEESVAQTDYKLKVQAHHFWGFLRTLQDVRRGVRDARDRTSS